MSITVTTDVFCDVCSQWVHGVTGSRSNSRAARKVARAEGWVRRSSIRDGKLIDICPLCRHAGAESDWGFEWRSEVS